MWIIILSILLLISIITMIVGFRVAVRKIEFYEDWVTLFKSNVNSIFEEMRAIDENGSFEADDEVGTIFSAMRELIGELNKYIIGEEK